MFDPPKEPLRRFFDFVVPEVMVPATYIEFRQLIGKGANLKFVHTTEEATDYASSMEFTNLFFGVMRRTEVSGKRTDVVPFGNILWADFDLKTGFKFNSLQSGELPPPCIIIASGNGYHAYWKLNTYVDTPVIENLNKNIASILGGDHVYDAARIMRVPYSINKKPGLPPSPVRFLRLITVCPGHYMESFTISDGSRSKARALKLHHAMPPGHISRSERLFSIAVRYALKHGPRYDLNELEEQMLAVPEGSKLLEMSPPRRKEWIDLTYKNARRTILRRAAS